MFTQTKRIFITLFVALVLGACTPHDAIQVTFGNSAIGGSERLAQEARNVATCESGNGEDFSTVDPGAVSPTNDHGLFQINRPSWERKFTQVTGQPWEKVYDPMWNAVFAKWLYDQDGWSHWTCRYAA